MSKNTKQKGWLFNVEPVSKIDESNIELSGLKLYFVAQNGDLFSISFFTSPYFYIKTKKSYFDIDSGLRKKFPGLIRKTESVKKVDLNKKNHLSGLMQVYTKISLYNQPYLKRTKDIILKHLEGVQSHFHNSNSKFDILSEIEEIREYDLPFTQRVMIDHNLRVGKWYEVERDSNDVARFEEDVNKIDRPNLKTCAFDIETTKEPLRFPDAETDSIIMISLMIDGQGFLIVNREIVSEEITDFEYTPKPNLEGPFRIFNENNEICLLQRFFELLKSERPRIYVTYNGDFFDWPFIEKRCQIHKFNLPEEIGIFMEKNQFKGRFSLHLDAFSWVKRDSYLPIGSQGLKAVVKAMLGYDPVELDPEKIVELASSDPQSLATYSVSDAVATFYLYSQYVHSFIFSLCGIVPLPANSVLRKGTGTLCEALLLAEAFSQNIIAPNKQVEQTETFHKGHLLESETYVGGHVECIESGVFREDIPIRFRIQKKAIENLIQITEEVVEFVAEKEHKLQRKDITNFDSVVENIRCGLRSLSSNKTVTLKPSIYHFDVISMYPNIILSNRLQPVSVKVKEDCAACDFNLPGNRCQRFLDWKWRGKVYPLNKGEYNQIKAQLDVEDLPTHLKEKGLLRFSNLPKEEKTIKIQKRVKEYCRKVYKKLTNTIEKQKTVCICQRENPFYVDTVRSFRDRRYNFKNSLKIWRKRETGARSENEAKSARSMAILYDSMQLAHKCILNSFYGYVMRKSSRWYSMPMAAVTTSIGASIIKGARELIDRIGRPLELDTDGIWCCLPSTFPGEFRLETVQSTSHPFSFPCSVLNVMTHRLFTNEDYQTLVDENKLKYERRSECTIFFEVDGPYRCMLLPASPEEGKTLKKRYAVFNRDGSLAELKGFEMKRRGELKVIKIFQTEVFPRFLEGISLEEVYQKTAEIANYWLDIIDRNGVDLREEEIFELFTESKNMSRDICEYETENSTSITCAKRISEFLGEKCVEGAGLSLKFIVSREPKGKIVSQRVIPTAIFKTEKNIKRRFLRKWCEDFGMTDFDVRKIIDWDYYRTRIGACIRKIVTLPAAMQKIPNPVDRLPHPKWLTKLTRKRSDLDQSEITNFFLPPRDDEVHEKNEEKESSEKVETYENGSKTQENRSKKKEKRKKKTEVKKMDKKFEEDIAKWGKAIKRRWDQMGEKSKKLKKRKKSDESFDTSWQIAKVDSTQVPGVFRFWVFTGDGALKKIAVIVPRTFIVNRFTSRNKTDLTALRKLQGVTIQRSNKVLSRLLKAPHLYEVKVEELELIQHKNELYQEQCDFHTEGIYELCTPLLFDVVSRFGVAAKLKRGHLGQLRESAFKKESPLNANNMKKADVKSQNYLKGISSRQIFLYHSKLGNRGVFALFEKCHKDKLTKVFFVLLSPAANDEISSIPFKKVAQQYIQNDVAVETVSESSFKKAVKTVKEFLKKHETSGSFLVIQSQTDLDDLLKIADNFPIVSVAFNNSDSSYPAFNWVRFLFTRAIRRFVVVEEWWAHQLLFARYAEIPIGNLSEDNLVLIADVLFSRLLREQNIVSGASFSGRPDFGGRERDENVVADREDMAETVQPGCFRCFCVEIDISILAVCAILESKSLRALENSSCTSLPKQSHSRATKASGSGIRKTFFGYGETNSCALVFKILVQFVNNLFYDVARKKNSCADLVLMNLYRWLRSKASFFHNPSLCRFVHLQMTQYLHLLVEEFKKLETVVVFSSFNKIIISTDKSDLSNAMSYTNYLLETISSRDLFSLLEMKPGKVWRSLVFLAKENFAGVEHVESVETNELSTHWNMCEYLPLQAEKGFQVVVSMFILDPMNSEKEHSFASKKERQTFLSSFCKQLVRQKVTRYLFNVLPELRRTLKNYILEREESHHFRALSLGNDSKYDPVLDMVNYVCAVMSLDKEVELEVVTLKNSLLKLLSVAQFSPEAQFEDPALSFVLRDMVCSFCNRTSDIDLCKDSMALSKKWNCKKCLNVFDLELVEMAVVHRFREFVVGTLTQDLFCERCKQSKTLLLARSCSCSGDYKAINFADSIYQTYLYKKLSEFYGFKWLESCLEDSIYLMSFE